MLRRPQFWFLVLAVIIVGIVIAFIVIPFFESDLTTDELTPVAMQNPGTIVPRETALEFLETVPKQRW